jgi:hypothetical protein
MPCCQRLYLAMATRPIFRKQLVKLRAQRWRREALLAALLTLAALVFIATAIVGTDSPDQEKSPVATAPKTQR